jgi:hypothetical protein
MVIKFHCVASLHFLYPFVSLWTFRLNRAALAIVIGVALNVTIHIFVGLSYFDFGVELLIIW